MKRSTQKPPTKNLSVSRAICIKGYTLKIAIFILSTLISTFSYAANAINCSFDNFHQTHHINEELNGYSTINQILEIVNLKTSKRNQSLSGQKRATNSSKWVELKRDGWETFNSALAGDFGEVLTIKHELGENTKGLRGWYAASLISSDVLTTYTRLGKCFIK